MRITWQTTRLELARPLRISRAALSARDAVWVCLREDGHTGWGEVVTSPRLGLDRDRVDAALSRWTGTHAGGAEDLRTRLPHLRATLPAPIVSALDSAVHDLLARRAGLPVATVVGAPRRDRMPTACTIGLTTPEDAAERATELTGAGFSMVKIKLGAPDPADDLATVRAVRRAAPTATLLLDPNGAWDVTTAIRVLTALAELDIAAVEQPVPPGRLPWLAAVAAAVPIPILADEDAGTLADLDALPAAIGGINIKLAECGGLHAASAMITRAADRGWDILLGCQAASSLGIAPAAHLLGHARWADLDGHLLLANDPWTGLGGHDGLLSTPAGPGLGVTRAPETV